ncbi:ATP-binding protein [Pelagibacterium sp. 26DY04]|uniref:ATP-binding protein n=1 Tax=Pelagibacterium sp. 26DY04 TaxID=2967130 RepID=UPI002815667E|nr:ATP-binding protein [Pelagibacterium sp. 26DY04]WMT88780.1 ATP-binding protein [Pelagibacterium sp. 26DY04]
MENQDQLSAISATLERIAHALDALAGTTQATAAIEDGIDAYLWDGAEQTLIPVPHVNRVPLDLLEGVAHLRDILLDNTLAFARGHGANNALLWGARGMGKSSMVKAIHAHITALEETGLSRLILIEIAREDIATLPALLRFLVGRPERFIIYCDDLSFDRDESSYKALKSVLDGGLEGRPANTVFYATSNRRHLMPRDMIDNERSTAINPGEAVEEKVSLSDRFGLWLGFHNCDQDTYLAMVRNYVAHYGIPVDESEMRAKAIEWSATRGSRSGRVAIQFVRHLAGEKGKAIS